MDEEEISLEELRKILVRSHAATEGPWRSFVEGRDHFSGDDFIQTAGNDIHLSGATQSDQDFIASARQDVDRLAIIVAKLKGWDL